MLWEKEPNLNTLAIEILNKGWIILMKKAKNRSDIFRFVDYPVLHQNIWS